MPLASRSQVDRAVGIETEEAPEETDAAPADDAEILSVQEILDAPDIEEQTITVPQWKTKSGKPGAVKIRSLTKERQQAIRKMARDPKTGEYDNDKLELFAFIEAVVEPQFVPIQFTELRKKSAAALDLVIRAVMKMNGLSGEAVADAVKSAEV